MSTEQLLAGSRPADSASLAGVLAVKPLAIEDLADLRALHVASLRSLAASRLEAEELVAMLCAVGEPGYAERVMRANPVGGWLAGRLIVTAGWLRTADRATVARIEHVHVDPLFARLGLGRHLVRHVEGMARKCGFREFSARPTLNAVGFFERIGYRAASFGVRNVARGVAVPVAHMRFTPRGELKPAATGALPCGTDPRRGSAASPHPAGTAGRSAPSR